METFLMWLLPILSICIGIMILTIFFKFINWAAGGSKIIQAKKIKGFLVGEKFVDVHLSCGKIIKTVKFDGFTKEASGKSNIPYQLSSMAVFESEDGRRILIASGSIRVLEEINKEVEQN